MADGSKERINKESAPLTSGKGGADRRTAMERYTIRILYRDRNNPRKFVGVVEEPGATVKRGFVSMDGLWRILKTPTPGSGREKAASFGEERDSFREDLLDLFRSLREE
jgi:hypothetical protein